MKQRFNLTLMMTGSIIFAFIIAAVFCFAIFKKHGGINENSVFSDDILANINMAIPSQYAQSLTVTAFNNTLSITPVNAKSNSIPESIDTDTIKYVEAYVNTDVIQIRQKTKLKESLILKSPGHPDKFEYQFDLNKYDFEKDNNGNIYFYVKGKKGNELYKLFTIPAPFMVDQKGAESSAKDVRIALSDQGVLTIEPDKNWLSRAQYPVMLDPTIEINILNVHSHPQQGENWEVNFTTQGKADLKIIPQDQATIDDDEFVSLWCGAEQRQPQILPGDIIFYPNWFCEGVGKIVHYTKKAGNHTLRFEFGGALTYAYNEASSGSVILRPGVILKRNIIFGHPAPAAAWACGDSVTFTYKGSSVTYGTVNSTSSKCWLDRNLGATQVAVNATDTAAYGDLFQWGRLDDLHQIRTSGTTTATSSTDVPGHNKFIYGMPSPYDWRVPQNNNLWQGVSGTNNPCPSGWRTPTSTEWNTERLSWSSNNSAGAFASPLKLTLAGRRHSSSASLGNVDSRSFYWSSTVSGTGAYVLDFDSGSALMGSGNRAFGCSVRCLKD